MSIEIVKNIEEKILSLNTTDLIKYILENHNNVALSSSLGSEDQVLTDMIFKVNKNSRVSFGCNKFKIWCKNRSFFPKI